MSNGTTIMTHTLPTIVGMGVVSETTRTMFGKGRGGRKSGGSGRRGGGSGKRGTTRGRVVIPKTRTFDGKTYQAANWHPTKAQAEKDAAYFRKAGHYARIVRELNSRTGQWGYMVYVR